MSLGYEDLLEELELLPQWQHRNPPAQQTNKPEEEPVQQAEAQIEATFRMVSNTDANMLFVLDRAATAEANQLFAKMLKVIDFSIGQDFAEANKEQFADYQAAVVIVLGAKLGQYILQQSMSLDQLRQQVHAHQGRQVIVTYAVEDLLQNTQNKAQCWQDLCLAQLTIDNLKSGN